MDAAKRRVCVHTYVHRTDQIYIEYVRMSTPCLYVRVDSKEHHTSNKAILGKKKHQGQAGLELGRLDQGRDRKELKCCGTN